LFDYARLSDRNTIAIIGGPSVKENLKCVGFEVLMVVKIQVVI
jgi:hypothetical protein